MPANLRVPASLSVPASGTQWSTGCDRSLIGSEWLGWCLDRSLNTLGSLTCRPGERGCPEPAGSRKKTCAFPRESFIPVGLASCLLASGARAEFSTARLIPTATWGPDRDHAPRGSDPSRSRPLRGSHLARQPITLTNGEPARLSSSIPPRTVAIPSRDRMAGTNMSCPVQSSTMSRRKAQRCHCLESRPGPLV